jgi:phosphoribosylamine--glycine ligase
MKIWYRFGRARTCFVSNICEKQKGSKIFCAKRQCGIAEVAECIDIKPDEIERLADFAQENAIDLTFVGGETSLALGNCR